MEGCTLSVHFVLTTGCAVRPLTTQRVLADVNTARKGQRGKPLKRSATCDGKSRKLISTSPSKGITYTSGGERIPIPTATAAKKKSVERLMTPLRMITRKTPHNSRTGLMHPSPSGPKGTDQSASRVAHDVLDRLSLLPVMDCRSAVFETKKFKVVP